MRGVLCMCTSKNMNWCFLLPVVLITWHYIFSSEGYTCMYFLDCVKQWVKPMSNCATFVFVFFASFKSLAAMYIG